MKPKQKSLFLWALLLPVSSALAQTGDWQVVESLRQRTLISVEDMHHVIHDACRFQGVVDDQLFCEYGPHLFGPGEIAFRQESIRAVRREHNGTLIGLAVGAGAGAVFGAARDPDPGIGRGGSALVGAGVYGLFGAIIGSAHDHFSHGKVIYQNPDEKTKTSESLPTDRDPTNDFSTADRIAAARDPYTQLEGTAADTNTRLTLAQVRGHRPGPPFSPRAGYARPVYPQMWSGRPSGRHALVGAIIGGLLGAAVAAKGNAGVRATFAISALGAGLGAGIGLSVPSYPGPQMYRRGWRDDHEEASGSNSAFRPDLLVAEAQSAAQSTENPLEVPISGRISRAEEPPALTPASDR